MDYPDFSNASCRGMDVNLFFMTDDEQASKRLRKEVLPTIKKMCSECPVVEDCLMWGLKHETHGLWGGMTEKERATMRVKSGIKFESLQGLIPSWTERYGRNR